MSTHQIKTTPNHDTRFNYLAEKRCDPNKANITQKS